MSALKVWWLKRQFRASYLHYRDTHSGLGLSMAGMLQPSIYASAKRCNEIAEKLMALDPQFPKTWQPLPEK